MGSAIREWLRARVPGMLWGALFGAGLAVMGAIEWAHPLPHRQHSLWPYPDIMGLRPREILLAELKWGAVIMAYGAVIGLFTKPPQAVVDFAQSLVSFGQDLLALCRRALAAIRYVTRPRITFLD